MTRILLVEDDAKARMLLAQILESVGNEVVSAPDGETGIERLKEQTFDVVVTDIRMRNVDGIGVLTVARELPDPPEVILLTGFGALETSLAALRSGAFDYLLKPCAPSDLLERVAAAAARREANHRQAGAIQTIAHGIAQLYNRLPSQQLLPAPPAPGQQPAQQQGEPERFANVGALTIDRFRHSATLDGQPLHLTPIEYGLLACLSETLNRVVGYCEIVRYTHGYTVDEVEAQTLLKAHVRNLRRKIPPDYLVNVRGTGYMLTIPEEEDEGQ